MILIPYGVVEQKGTGHLCVCVSQLNNSGSDGKVSDCNAGDPGLIPGSGRSPAEGKGNPLQYSCLKNPMDRRAWWATAQGVAKESDTTRPRHNNKCLFVSNPSYSQF